MCQVVAKLPPLAPTTTRCSCHGPPARLRRDTTTVSPPTAPFSTPLTLTAPRSFLSRFAVNAWMVVLSTSGPAVPATSPPVWVLNSRRWIASPFTVVPSTSTAALLALVATRPPLGIDPIVISWGCQVRPPSVVLST